ncbi:methylated-DNA--[protein]-cysteine S-methyltransferase [Microbulbifer sp. OS29]|uniref:Methylated-DNA--protein-cysteine methyltransferase n=1 Tax=Microbulbifer okhotskensis TaxID=2926617 RepID=A0A9X2ELT8_9GAMM|nr:methylated-DNA--[protein]-cysteine S-methyltransferase [Microbulbifer okhotskensis]MCO1334607.1 methylated-DNA--[protein]-cysteine S-methyltransferase [Microbulbifer okhotskensis]
MITYECYSTELGDVAIAACEVGDEGVDNGIVALQFYDVERPLRLGADWQRGGSELTDMAAQQLREYMAGQRRSFNLSLAPRGTEFQRRVWDALVQIPFGETRSYSQQAQFLGQPRAIRAVARANGANPLAVMIPCHRVIGANGSLTGYAGGLALKAQLLTLEGANFISQGELL